MRTFEVSRRALSIGVAGALLSACGGSSVPIATDYAIGAGGLKYHQTFSYTGGEQTFIVPAGVTQLAVVALGGKGGGRAVNGASYDPGGSPGRVYALIPVQPGDKLHVFVGGWPGYYGTAGGFNGGGIGGGGRYAAYGGGGASDVRMGGDKLKDRVVVAAGGGGAGSCYYYCSEPGGNGGGLTGKPGGGGGGTYGKGGGGGTQRAGGSGGAGGQGKQSGGNGMPGGNGALGLGGSGGTGGTPSGSYYLGFPGGGGGGGYYGGGGGGGSASAGNSYSEGGGGGGGSSYVEPSATKSRLRTGWKKAKGAGQVVFSWN